MGGLGNPFPGGQVEFPGGQEGQSGHFRSLWKDKEAFRVDNFKLAFLDGQ